MKGVVDMQLMELATRHAGGRGFVKGLYNAISDLRLTLAERYAWQQKKKAGGSFEGTPEWTKRPLPEMLIDYAAGDTVYLPHLYAVYREKLRPYPSFSILFWLDQSDESEKALARFTNPPGIMHQRSSETVS